MRTLAAVAALALIAVLALAADEPGAPFPPGRGGLTLPDDVWDEVLTGLERPGRPLGFTAAEMAHYSGRKHLLRTVENLFRDVRAIPRYSGKLAESFVKYAPKPAEALRVAYGLTDAVAGRMAPMPKIDDLTTDEELTSEFERQVSNSTEGDPEAFQSLPFAERRLILRLIRAVRDEEIWIRMAFVRWHLERRIDVVPELVYEIATAPLTDERLGQLATIHHQAFEALEVVDRNYLAFGSVLLVARITQALDEYRAAEREKVPAEFPGLALDTSIGRVRVYGTRPDVIDEPAGLSIDLGGDDQWLGCHASAKNSSIGIAIDLRGNDRWDGEEEEGALGAGLFGVGVLFDLEGDDTYVCRESGIGCAWFGTGLIVDSKGNDRYETKTHWGQGCGYAGVGMLIDESGDDEYVIGYDGQGYGATLGAGVLIDVEGNDRYLARDDGNISKLYKDQSVSMAQGVGQGRRADLGDGHSLAGGFGVLVDGAGDDDYHATCWSHGAGYWWAVGILEDLGGNDTYRDGKYSLGAGAHFAIGVCADLEGDDAYNIGYGEAVNQYQGHARDGSIGVFFDGDGDDRYQLRAHCGGSGDLASIGLFWDRRGDDVYEITAVEMGKGGDWGGTPPLGSSTFYKPMRSYRDDLHTSGVFLDTGGRDKYLGPEGPWGDGRTWPTRRGDRYRGYGRDLERFPK